MFWYSEAVEKLEALEVSVQQGRKKVLFYGSSTFTLWTDLPKFFPKYHAQNLAFGGSTLAACSWFFPRIVPRHEPDMLVVYAGDNDIGDGRTSEEVIIYFEHLMGRIRSSLGDIPVLFVGIKYSPLRWNVKGAIDYANSQIADRIGAMSNTHYMNMNPFMLDMKGLPGKQYFKPDRLHLSREAYILWAEKINEKILDILG